MSKQARLDALKIASGYTSDADEAIIIASEFAYFIENGDRVNVLRPVLNKEVVWQKTSSQGAVVKKQRIKKG